MAIEDDQPIEINKQGYNIHMSAHALFMHNSMTDAFHKQLDNELNVMKFGKEWSRKSHRITISKPENVRGEYDDFVELWKQVTEYGLSRDFLIDNYEGKELAEFYPNTYETVFDETEEEWEARKALLPKTVTFPVAKRRDDL